MRCAAAVRGVAVLSLALTVGCGPMEAGEAGTAGAELLGERVAVQRQQIRPTDGTGWNNNGFGIPAQVYDPPGGHFRVYYVTSGENAVDLTDVSPADGVPDFVAQVGTAAEQELHRFARRQKAAVIGAFHPSQCRKIASLREIFLHHLVEQLGLDVRRQSCGQPHVFIHRKAFVLHKAGERRVVVLQHGHRGQDYVVLPQLLGHAQPEQVAQEGESEREVRGHELGVGFMNLLMFFHNH